VTVVSKYVPVKRIDFVFRPFQALQKKDGIVAENTRDVFRGVVFPRRFQDVVYGFHVARIRHTTHVNESDHSHFKLSSRLQNAPSTLRGTNLSPRNEVKCKAQQNFQNADQETSTNKPMSSWPPHQLPTDKVKEVAVARSVT
jgi:hypothetical protein